MKQGVLITFGAILLIGILAVLSAVTYVQKERLPDREASPNRSTFNSGATGTQAFYTLLAETGHSVVRWQGPPTELITSKNKTAVFVVVGAIRRQFTKTDADALMRWVSSGGRLVVIDRDPPRDLVRTTADWNLSISSGEQYELFSTDPSDAAKMTEGAGTIAPVQPSIFASGVERIQPSRFAGAVSFARADAGDAKPSYDTRDRYPRHGEEVALPVTADLAPNALFASQHHVIAAEAPYGSGKIVFLADPFIVANSGISLADNAKLAVNLVNVSGGVIAFDEYHNGYGTGSNRLLEFFAGTPVIAIFVQAFIIVGLIFYSQGRRFARAVPQPEPNRLSKLEYIAAMSELQRRTGAVDLAIENIYADFRRRVSRQIGLNDPMPKAMTMAAAIAERTGEDKNDLESLLTKCEDTMHGALTSRKQALDLAIRLRELESRLGLGRIKPGKV